MGGIKITKQFSIKFKKALYVLLGLAFLILSYFGIIMPGVPAIPFILLSLFFFSNGSEKWHAWMLSQKIIVKIVDKLNTKHGAIGFKLFVISQLWVSILVAKYIFISDLYATIWLLICGVGLSIITYILMEKR